MPPKVISVRHGGDHRLELSFEDGLSATIDFGPRIVGRGGVWQPLQNIEYFKRVRIDPELMTLVWPNGADICPDLLYCLASGKPICWVQDSGSETVEAVRR